MSLRPPFFFALLSLALPGIAEACRCLPPEPPTLESVRTSYCEADVVFEGAVTGHVTVDHGAEYPGEEQIFTLTPYAIYRGPDSPSFVSRFVSTASCDYRFEKDQRYLVFGNTSDDGDNLRVSFCGYTSTTQFAAEKIALLDELLAAEANPCAGLAETVAEPASREVPANPVRDTRMPEPPDEEESLWTKILIDFMALSVPGYLILQFFTLLRYRDRWRRLAKLPLFVMVPLMAYTVFALLANSNLWPLLLLFLTPFAFVYLVALMLMRYFALRRVTK